jgi:hypothetical protein
MNVRITPRDAPQRTELYSSVFGPLRSDGHTLTFETKPRFDLYTAGWLLSPRFDGGIFRLMACITRLPMSNIAEIALDEDGGAT